MHDHAQAFLAVQWHRQAVCAGDWSGWAFTDNQTVSVFPVIDPNPTRNMSQPPKLCAAWLKDNSPFGYSGGYADGYGHVAAYPAKKLQAQCHESSTQQLDSSYTCDNETGLPVISNFWSTNAVDENTLQSLSRVLVDVLVLDDMNQTVSIGECCKAAIVGVTHVSKCAHLESMCLAHNL